MFPPGRDCPGPGSGPGQKPGQKHTVDSEPPERPTVPRLNLGATIVGGVIQRPGGIEMGPATTVTTIDATHQANVLLQRGPNDPDEHNPGRGHDDRPPPDDE